MRKRNPSNSNSIVLLAAGGFALYYFWPQLSAAFGANSGVAGDGSISYPTGGGGFTTQEPNLTDAQLAVLLALENQGYPGTAQSSPPQGSTTTTSGVSAPMTTGAPLAPGSPATGVNIVSNPITLPPALQPLATIPSVTVRSQNPTANPSQFTSQVLESRATANSPSRGIVFPAPNAAVPVTGATSGPGLTAPTTRTPLQGIRRLRGAVSREAARAAALVQAKLNNSITYDAPQVTNDSPIGPWTPGATPLPGGCYSYGNTPVLMNCPAGAVPATPGREAQGKCMAGYTMSDTGECAKTDDQVRLARLNSTPYVPGSAVSLNGISAAILGLYVTTIGVNPGSQLAAYLGLPPNQAFGTFAPGNDGFNYLMLRSVYMRQGTQTQLTRPTGPIGPRPGPLPAGTKLKGIVPAAVPITNATLIAASSDPKIAATLGNDPRAMLTVQQWNYYYTQSTGVLQIAPPYPATDPNTLMTAAQYQQWRIMAGLTPAPPKKGKLGVILNSRPGAFPLGGISDGPMRVPFVTPGNNNIYRIPGQGAGFQSKRLGVILDGGGDHRWAQSPFPRPAWWRLPEA